MGGSSSRELEAAQSQVRRLTGELQKASQQLRVQQSGAALKLAADALGKTPSQIRGVAQRLGLA